MTPEKIRILLKQTQKLMYGFNYEVTLGIEVYKNCFSLPHIHREIKGTFCNASPDEATPVRISQAEFYNEVTDRFNYRGDHIGVALVLTEKKEKNLKSKQSEVLSYLEQYIKPHTEIYSYSFLDGLPGYPVFWEYTFVLLNKDGNSVLFYGSSSD